MREKTNSITELVKIVAREIIKGEVKVEVKKAIKEEMDNSKYTYFEIRRGVDINSNSYWTKFEDSCLKCEFEEAVNKLAKKHGRSTVAIIHRIKKEDLLNY